VGTRSSPPSPAALLRRVGKRGILAFSRIELIFHRASEPGE
jgi:hypothetical protein